MKSNDMKKLSRSFALLSSVAFLSVGAYAAPTSIAQLLGGTESVPTINAQNAAQTVEVLAEGQHLDLTHRKGFEVFDVNSAEYALYQKQLQAIETLGANRTAAAIPQLLDYADYPANNRTNVPSVPTGDVSHLTLKALWPTYKSIAEMGAVASPELQKFIADGQQPLCLRLTALQILRDISRKDAQTAGLQLQMEAQKSGQLGAVTLVDAIVSGKLPFWGKIGYEPVTLTQQQVMDLLAPNRYLPNAFSLVYSHGMTPHFRAIFAPGKDSDEKYALVLQQKEAIRTVGELRVASLVPNLVQFITYPGEYIWGGALSIDFSTVEGDRLKYPALDAIMKIGDDAKTPLVTLANNSKENIKLRLRALYVLHYLDDPASQNLAQDLADEFEKAGDIQTVAYIRGIVGNDLRQRTLAKAAIFKPA